VGPPASVKRGEAVDGARSFNYLPWKINLSDLSGEEAMLSREENEMMCRVGAGTAMGAVLRRYWLPALSAADLPEPDGDPRHVELLGEHFVAFRDTNGRVGILDEKCCHRGASLLLGRVEECGIRCIYHGWKFAVDGTVLETPNVPDAKFRTRVKARAYPVHEAGGLIWVYLGQEEKRPPFPEWPWLHVPATNRINACAVVNCNYVQVIEGLVDSSHLNILHDYGMRSTGSSQLTFAQKVGKMQVDASPRIEAEDTEFGFHYAALRTSPDATGARATLARVAAFVAPCFVANPNGDLAFAVVPVNDYRTNFYHVWWDANRNIGEEPARSQQLKFVGLDPETLDSYGMGARSCDAPGRAARANRYLQDRRAMRAGNHFTGLPSFTQEDAAVAISAGAIRDRTKESLSIADVAVGRLYRVLLKCARDVQEGRDPVGLAPHVDVSGVVGVEGNLQEGQPWQALVPRHKRLGRSDSAAGKASADAVA
jgi:phenylpropionate dioxygenase-like ring-hydroxylating dioxygenase large terminal subunit